MYPMQRAPYRIGKMEEALYPAVPPRFCSDLLIAGTVWWCTHIVGYGAYPPLKILLRPSRSCHARGLDALSLLLARSHFHACVGPFWEGKQASFNIGAFEPINPITR